MSAVELEALQRIFRQGLTVGHEMAEVGPLGRAACLAGCDPAVALRIIDAVLAERNKRDTHEMDLVWTGPEVAASGARDTAVVVREMFASAQTSVLVAGFSFDHGADIFEPLYCAMRDRAVETQIFLDVKRAARGETDIALHVRREIDGFLHANWPFGAPFPHLFYDPRTVTPESTTSLHAKCIVVDERRALVTSANFTSRGQSRNVEVGLLLDNVVIARRLVHQWRNAASAGSFVVHRPTVRG